MQQFSEACGKFVYKNMASDAKSNLLLDRIITLVAGVITRNDIETITEGYLGISHENVENKDRNTNSSERV